MSPIAALLSGVAALWMAWLTYARYRDEKKRADRAADLTEQEKAVADLEKKIEDLNDELGKANKKVADLTGEILSFVERLGKLTGAVQAYSMCPSHICPFRNGHGEKLPDEFTPRPLE